MPKKIGLICTVTIPFNCYYKIRHNFIILYVKLIIISANRAGGTLCVFPVKISVLSPKLVIICATRAGANLSGLAFKICVPQQKFVTICVTCAGAKLGVIIV